MIKKILANLALKLINFAFVKLWKYVDKDKNGELNKKEIEVFLNDMRSRMNKLKKRLF